MLPHDAIVYLLIAGAVALGWLLADMTKGGDDDFGGFA